MVKYFITVTVRPLSFLAIVTKHWRLKTVKKTQEEEEALKKLKAGTKPMDVEPSEENGDKSVPDVKLSSARGTRAGGRTRVRARFGSYVRRKTPSQTSENKKMK